MPEANFDIASHRGVNHPAAARWAAAQAVLRANAKTQAVVPHGATQGINASFAQERLWFIEQLNPGTSLHNLPVLCRMSGKLSRNAIEQAVTDVVGRYDVLRTRVSAAAEALSQTVCDLQPHLLRHVNLEPLADDERQAELDRLTLEVAQRPFALTAPLLPRLVLARINATQHCLIVCFHHLVFDGWSFAIFMRELSITYNARLAGHSVDRPAPALQYSDYALWQRAPAQLSATEESRIFWRRALRSPGDVLRMPTDNLGRAKASGRGAVLPFKLSLDQSLKLLALCQSEGTSLFALLLSIFKVFLYRFTAHDDLWVGCPVANRPRTELAEVMGVFANTLVMRTQLKKNAPFMQMLAAVQRTVDDALAHQASPYQQVVRDIAPNRDSFGGSLLQVMFAHQNLPSADCQFNGLSVDLTNVHNGAAGAELTLFSWLKNGQVGGLWEWDTGLYDRVDVTEWAARFSTLVDSVVGNPRAAIDSLRLMGAAAPRQWSDRGACAASRADLPLTVHAAFERQVRRTPNAVALVDAAGTLTFAQLDCQAAQLAATIASHNHGSRRHVGVCLAPSRNVVIAMLGILKAGLAYVPLGSTEPIPRLQRIIYDAHITHVVTDTAHALRVQEAQASPLLVGEKDVDSALGRSAVALPAVEASSLACVMYTSGSSGQPKGVCVAHQGITRLVVESNFVALGPNDVLLQLAPIAFDASTFEIWGALLNGARLVVPSREPLSLRDIAELIEAHAASVLWLTTGLFEAMVDEQMPALGRLQQLLVGGDVLSLSHAQRFVEAFPACRLLNCYGPTENTTFTTVHVVNRTTSFNGSSVPIGRAISGTQVYVLDHHRQPVPQGVVGEAFVAGQGLMLGYLVGGAPDTSGMLKRPDSDAPAALMYGTGDRVRQRRDGEFEFIGRTDEQVKIRGHRVELAEVTAALNRCAGVTRGVTVVDGETATDKRLIAFVTVSASAQSEPMIATLIQTAMRRELPAPLVPNDIRIVSALPLTQSGKLDRAELRRILGAASRLTEVEPGANGASGAIETLIAGAFGSALGVAVINRDDNFFALGGHSLLALRVVATLEKALNSRIPLVSLFAHPTPAELARALTRLANASRVLEAASPLSSGLVEIKRGTSATPLFVVPGGHGGMVEMTLYARLMEQVGGELTVYGIVAPGVDGRLKPLESVQATASAYLAEIRLIQPHGPYSLCGECVGGVIALEMAQQLRVNGENVASLLLLDTWLPTDAGVRHFRLVERPITLLLVRARLVRAACADLTHVLVDHIGKRPRTSPYGGCRYAVSVALTLVRVALAWMSKIGDPEQAEAGQEGMKAAESQYVHNALAYRAQPYPGAVTVIACASNARRGIFRDWSTIAGSHLSTHTVPGTHDTYIKRFVEQTAGAVRTCLAQDVGRAQPLTSVRNAERVDHAG